MGCMRCGRKTAGKDAFCAECLAEMEKYPVKPGVIHIPRRPVRETKPKRKKELSAEEQLIIAHRKIRSLHRWVAGLLAALLLSAGALAYTIFYEEPASPPPSGRNYTTVGIDGN